MRVSKWSFAFLAVALSLGCNPNIQREIQLAVTSEPPGAQIYENGKLIGEAPLNLVYKYEVTSVPGLLFLGKYTDGEPRYFKPEDFSIQDLLKPRAFTAVREGFKPQTKSFQFTSPHEKDIKSGIAKASAANTWIWKGLDFFNPTSFALPFALESLDGAFPAQRPQSQEALIGSGAAKTFGTLTVLTTPPQAEVYIDFERAGTTPVTDLRLEAGQHFIEIKKSGYRTWARAVQVAAQPPIRLEITLDKN